MACFEPDFADRRGRRLGRGAVAHQNPVRPWGLMAAGRTTSNPGDRADEARLLAVRKIRSVPAEFDGPSWDSPRPPMNSTTRTKVSASVSRRGNVTALVGLPAVYCPLRAASRGRASKAFDCRSAIRVGRRNHLRRQPTTGLLTAGLIRAPAAEPRREIGSRTPIIRCNLRVTVLRCANRLGDSQPSGCT